MKYLNISKYTIFCIRETFLHSHYHHSGFTLSSYVNINIQKHYSNYCSCVPIDFMCNEFRFFTVFYFFLTVEHYNLQPKCWTLSNNVWNKKDKIWKNANSIWLHDFELNSLLVPRDWFPSPKERYSKNILDSKVSRIPCGQISFSILYLEGEINHMWQNDAELLRKWPFFWRDASSCE